MRAVDNPPPDNWATGIVVLSNYILDEMYVRRLNMPAPAPMIEVIKNIAPRPIMLIAGGTPHPYFGSESVRAQYYAQRAGPNARVWVIPEAYHCDGPIQRPDEYAMCMVSFFDNAFKSD